MTAEEFAKQQHAAATALHQANLRSLARMCNTTPEQIEEAFRRIEANPDSSLGRLNRVGRRMGEQLGERIRAGLNAWTRAYRR